MVSCINNLVEGTLENFYPAAGPRVVVNRGFLPLFPAQEQQNELFVVAH